MQVARARRHGEPSPWHIIREVTCMQLRVISEFISFLLVVTDELDSWHTWKLHPLFMRLLVLLTVPVAASTRGSIWTWSWLFILLHSVCDPRLVTCMTISDISFTVAACSCCLFIEYYQYIQRWFSRQRVKSIYCPCMQNIRIQCASLFTHNLFSSFYWFFTFMCLWQWFV